MDIAAEIRKFVVTNFYVPEPDDLSNDASLLDEGIVDSTGVLEVIGFIEETFDVTIEDEEMLPENLDSIAFIIAFVAKKQAG